MFNSVYNSNSVSHYQDSSAWLGSSLNAIQLHGGTAGWTDWLSSVGWEASLFKNVDTQILWSIPLIPYGATLGAAAAGSYNTNYLAMARQLLANSNGTDKIYVRLGWEFNGAGWNSSSAVGQPDNYAQAYRNFVTAARTISDKFVFEWCPNIGPTDMNPETAYPGDDYVDIVSVDMYYNTQWDSKDPKKAFDWFVKEPYGLQWQQDFAAAHGKQTAIGEWGLNSDSPEFVKLALQWFKDHNMVYQNYWDSNAAFSGELSDGQYANAASAFSAMLTSFASSTSTATIITAALADVAAAGTGAISATRDYVMKTTDVALTLGGTAHVGTGNALDNIIIGNDLGNTLNGNAGNDTLIGGKGNDILSGGTGNDTMVGGAGDDTYYVDSLGDRVMEKAGEGADTVYASVDGYTLSDNVETLYLTGSARSGTGNALDNLMMGTAGNDTLSGLAGNDTLKGGAGDDILLGGAGNDKLYGNEGNDRLDGGTGDDIMDGGAGNDTYVVDSVGDVVIELNGGGTDTVEASIDYTLGAYVENLTLTGSARSGVGNALNNVITANDLGDTLDGGAGNDTLVGGAGNDILIGGIGADTMRGGAGNDIYYVDDARDVVVEKANEGTDTVYASVDYTLGSWVENLTITGAARVASGNTLDNIIIGNDLGNTLNGNAGNDTLIGGKGNDILSGGTGSDTMSGGAGDDIYYVDSLGDVVIEKAGEGTDTVYASVDGYTLTANVENLYLSGAGMRGTGNALDNLMIGTGG